MKSIVCLLLGLLAAAAFVSAQTADVTKILADARAALGGEKKLAALKTFNAAGQAVRVVNNASQPATEVLLAFELPDKFVKTDVVSVINGMAITRTSGFNADQSINVVDQPPMGGGGMVMIRMGPNPEEAATPEQREQMRQKAVLSSKQELARLTAGMLLPLAVYPLQYSYAGQAESPDGKADVLDVTGEGGFTARLFIDSNTHLPLMLTWMAKEPIRVQMTMGGPGGGAKGAPPPPAGDKAIEMSMGKPSTPEERDRLMKQMEEQRKAAEANARLVEFRIYYADYRDVDGVKVPFKLQRTIDGKPTEEVTLDKVRVNGRIDGKRFETK